MVLPATEMAMRQQDRKLKRISRKTSSVDDITIKQQARAEALKAVQEGSRLYYSTQHATLNDSSEYSSRHQGRQSRNRQGSQSRNQDDDNAAIQALDVSVDYSTASLEKAVQMGSMRGLYESNERRPVAIDKAIPSPDSNLTRRLVRSAAPNLRQSRNFSANPPSSRSTLRNRKKRSNSGPGNLTNEAWMCGCCGKVFHTFKSADEHERICLERVIESLGNGDETRSQLDSLDLVDPVPNQVPAIVDPLQSERRVDDTLMHDLGLADDLPLGSFRSNPSNGPQLDDSALEISPSNEMHSVVTLSRRHQPSFLKSSIANGDVLLSNTLRKNFVMTDQALVESAKRAASMILTPEEIDAENELSYLARDKAYYAFMTERYCKLKKYPMNKFRTENQNVVSKIQNKFVDAWQLIKEGDAENEQYRDAYKKNSRGAGAAQGNLSHNANTHYVNVVVKHSIRVVNTELERLAMQRWEDQKSSTVQSDDQFDKFRKFAHGNLLRLAKAALAADFTPRKVAVQLSNDLYRLMAPQLNRRGVNIETAIEYRVDAYFVLAVNIKSIQWNKLIQYTHKSVSRRKKEWARDRDRRDELREDMAIEEGRRTKTIQFGPIIEYLRYLRGILCMSKVDIVAQFMSWMYYVHWTLSSPLCWLIYKVLYPSTMRKYILSTVADEIFSYVEEKGMEMDISIVDPAKQTAVMLSALRELREGKRAGNKNETGTPEEDALLGPLLGPASKSDKEPAPPIPEGFEIPENLEFINFEIDLPVGFKRLRWAMLNPQSNFVRDAVFTAAAKYDNIIFEDWSHHNEHIGSPSGIPDDVQESDFIGSERETQYLMPKSAFVKANTVFETQQITAYNDYCFCVKRRTLSPEVPYGSTFVAWTQMLFTNTGSNSCHLVCSVEAEFPNGPPMISRQIQSGMRSGTADLFVLMGETIIKYANEYP